MTYLIFLQRSEVSEKGRVSLRSRFYSPPSVNHPSRHPSTPIPTQLTSRMSLGSIPQLLKIVTLDALGGKGSGGSGTASGDSDRGGGESGEHGVYVWRSLEQQEPGIPVNDAMTLCRATNATREISRDPRCGFGRTGSALGAALGVFTAGPRILIL